MFNILIHGCKREIKYKVWNVGASLKMIRMNGGMPVCR